MLVLAYRHMKWGLILKLLWRVFWWHPQIPGTLKLDSFWFLFKCEWKDMTHGKIRTHSHSCTFSKVTITLIIIYSLRNDYLMFGRVFSNLGFIHKSATQQLIRLLLEEIGFFFKLAPSSNAYALCTVQMARQRQVWSRFKVHQYSVWVQLLLLLHCMSNIWKMPVFEMNIYFSNYWQLWN